MFGSVSRMAAGIYQTVNNSPPSSLPTSAANSAPILSSTFTGAPSSPLSSLGTTISHATPSISNPQPAHSSPLSSVGSTTPPVSPSISHPLLAPSTNTQSAPAASIQPASATTSSQQASAATTTEQALDGEEPRYAFLKRIDRVPSAKATEAQAAANMAPKKRATKNATTSTKSTTKKAAAKSAPAKKAAAKSVPAKKAAAKKATTTTGTATTTASKKRASDFDDSSSDSTISSIRTSSDEGPAPKKARTEPAKKSSAAKTSSSKTTASKGAKKATATAKKSTSAAAKPSKTTTAKKRAAEDDDSDDNKPPSKKVSRPRGARQTKTAPIINQAPAERFNVYVFGENSGGELGLGSQGNIIDVKRPRLNPHLPADTVGVVAMATGGMHVVALTYDNKILTWGVNDQGALGRDTTHDETLRDADDGDSDAGSDNGLNPVEATPKQISLVGVPTGTVFTDVAAGDSVTMAVTTTGDVYGCGTFRNNEGILGFSPGVRIQPTFTKVPGLKNVVKVVCGDNHVLALDNKGNSFSWGSGQQNQLARRVIERHPEGGLTPTQFTSARQKVAQLASGSFHSFAITKAGKLLTWGLNNFCQCGRPNQAGEDGAMVTRPTEVEALAGKQLVSITGGTHHSLAVTAEGEVFVWGRMDGGQSGIPLKNLPDEALLREQNVPRILVTPQSVPGMGKAVLAASGNDTNIVVCEDGLAYSWGFGVNYQTGQGTTTDILQPTHIDNTAVRGKQLVWAGLGAQYGTLMGEAQI